VAPTDLIQEHARTNEFSDGGDFSVQRAFGAACDFMQADVPTRSSQTTDDSGPTLTKAELVERLFQHVGLNKSEAKDMVEAFFAEISDALERGESVKLTGFGNFNLRDKVPRPGRNPRTGVEVNIAARRVVTFQPSQKLKAATGDSSTPSTPEHVDANDRG
jgi:integration host factor subunit alpha